MAMKMDTNKMKLTRQGKTNIIVMDSTKASKKILKIGTWHLRGLNGKEIELEE